MNRKWYLGKCFWLSVSHEVALKLVGQSCSLSEGSTGEESTSNWLGGPVHRAASWHGSWLPPVVRQNRECWGRSHHIFIILPQIWLSITSIIFSLLEVSNKSRLHSKGIDYTGVWIPADIKAQDTDLVEIEITILTKLLINFGEIVLNINHGSVSNSRYALDRMYLLWGIGFPFTKWGVGFNYT